MSCFSVLVGGSLLLGACGAATGDAPTDEASGSEKGSVHSAGHVVVKGVAFNPGSVDVAPGTRVTWTNEDAVAHTVTSGAPGKQGVPGVSEDRPARKDDLFEGKLDEQGASFGFTFEDSGTFEYFCEIHTSMRGRVSVHEGA